MGARKAHITPSTSPLRSGPVRRTAQARPPRRRSAPSALARRHGRPGALRRRTMRCAHTRRRAASFRREAAGPWCRRWMSLCHMPGRWPTCSKFLTSSWPTIRVCAETSGAASRGLRYLDPVMCGRHRIRSCVRRAVRRRVRCSPGGGSACRACTSTPIPTPGPPNRRGSAGQPVSASRRGRQCSDSSSAHDAISRPPAPRSSMSTFRWSATMKATGPARQRFSHGVWCARSIWPKSSLT
jgi:hypothetical protein